MTRILVIAYEAPPRLSAGAIATAKTLRAMEKAFQQPPAIDLICATPSGEVPRDDALANLLPQDLQAHCIDPFPYGRNTILQSIIGGQGGWQRAIESKAAALFPAEHKKPALLYSRSHPPASHLAALSLIEGPFKGVPWIAHFTEAWLQPGHYRTRAALGRYQQRVVETATRLFFVCEAVRDKMLANCSSDVRDKSQIIPHLFDPDLYTVPVKTDPAPETRTLLHAGSFLAPRSPAPILNGLNKLFQLHPDLRARLKVELVGVMAPEYNAFFELPELHAVTPRNGVSYGESLNVMQNADVLLAIDSRGPESAYLPSKLIDYLGAGKPIMGIAPKDSITASLLSNWNQPCCDISDSDSIVAAFKGVAKDPLWPPPPREATAHFGSARVGHKLAAAFRELLPDEHPTDDGRPD